MTVNGLQSNPDYFYIVPDIGTLTPSSGQIGAQVTISGSGFGASPGLFGGVTFNGVSAVVQTWSDTAVSVLVPQGATSGDVVVTNSTFLSSSGAPFTVNILPGVISGLSPTSGIVGSQVIVAGSNFGSLQGNSTVTFSGIPAIVSSWSDTSISVVVPPGASTGNVVVTVFGAAPSNGVSFAVASAIRSLYPPWGPVGSQVTISGSAFGPIQGNGSILFNGSSVPVTGWGDTRLTFNVPVGSVLGAVTVTALPNGSATGVSLPFTVTPGIASVSPNSGATGTLVTVQGSNFGATQGTTSMLTLGGTPLTISTWNDTQITATVPSGTATGVIQANVAGLASNPVPFSIPCNTPVASIAITPPNLSIFPGGDVPVTVVGDCGQPLAGVTLTSADTTVVEITADTPPRVYGVGPGTTTITATYSGLSAQATVTSFANAGFADGTSVYSIPPAPDAAFSFTIPAARTANSDTALFFVDSRPNVTPQAYRVRATSLSGTQLWTVNLPWAGNNDLVADNKGGLVYAAVISNGQAVVENIDTNGNLLWSQGVPTNPSGSFGPRLSIASDDSVYFVDDGGNIIALDGSTGNPKFAVPVGQFPGSGRTLNEGFFDVYIMSDGSACTPVIEQPLGQVSFDDFPTQPIFLDLTCAKPDGTYTTSVVDSAINSQIKTPVPDGFVDVDDFYSYDPSSVIPDENGNILALYQKRHFHQGLDGTSNNNNLFISTNGSPSQLPSACDNSTDYLMLLGDSGNALIACQGVSPHQASLVSMIIGEGSNWIWTLPQNHALALNSAAPGGGASATDATVDPLGGPTQFNVADVDGGGNPTYENWTVAGDTLAPIHDGIYVDGSSSSQTVIIATSNEADTAWGGSFQQGQGRATSVEFNAAKACSGFDETTTPRMLMVPATGSNTVSATLHGHIQQDVRFVSDNASVTISPPTPSGNTTTLTITAAAALDPTQTQPVTISAVSIADPAFVYGTMKAVVKQQLKAQNFHMYKVTESVRHLVPQSVPTAASLRSYLSSTWGQQANLSFTVANSDPIAISAHYDVLPAPNGNGVLDDFEVNQDSPEVTAIAQAVVAVDPLAGGTVDHTWVGYINKFGPPIIQCAQPPCAIDGESLTGAHISFVSDPAQDRSNSRENVTAHEIGHGLGLSHIPLTLKNGNKSLMWWGRGLNDPANPCEIRDRDWRIVNPTPGDAP